MKYMILAYDPEDGTREFCWDHRSNPASFNVDWPKYETENKSDALEVLKELQDYGKIYFPTCTYNLVAIYE